MGGLGNQMFQYAVSFAQGQDVFIDFSFLQNNNKSNEHFTARKFELDLFPNLHWKSFTTRHRLLYLSHSEHRLLGRLRSLLGFYCKWVVQQENEFVHIPNHANLYFVGYFQSEKYFQHKRAELLKTFDFPELDRRNLPYLNEIMAAENSVSVHIRRGDYLKPSVLEYHGILPDAYYTKSLEHIADRHSDTTLFVFSDDQDYAKSLFGDSDKVIYIQGNESSAWQDMALMTKCRHHIIANSSFSWWGAWLSQKSGITIAPKNWFNPQKVKFDIHDFIPKTWEIMA